MRERFAATGLRAQEDRLTADSAVGAARRAGKPPGLPATGQGSDYAELLRTVKGAGLLRRRPVYYSLKIGLNLLLLAAGWAAFAVLGQSWWQMLVAVFLAVMFTQTGFIGHDAGHRQISGSKRADGVIGRIHGNLLIGLDQMGLKHIKDLIRSRSQLVKIFRQFTFVHQPNCQIDTYS